MTTKPDATSVHGMPALLRACLMLGHPDRNDTRYGGILVEATQPFLLAMVQDPASDFTQAWCGLTPLAAWLSNQYGCFGKRSAPLRIGTVETFALAMLDAGADGGLGIEAWARGEGRPSLMTPVPDTCTEDWLLAHAVACPLAAALVGGHERVVERILGTLPEAGRGALLDRLQLADGEPIVHAAALHNPRMLAILLRAGGNPNLRNERGQTPLHMAGDAEAVGLLQRAGADETAVDSKGLRCDAGWRRRMAETADLDAMQRMLHERHKSMRDRVFLGGVTGSLAYPEKRLRAEGVETPVGVLAWTGVLARISGCLPGRRSAPNRSVIDWMRSNLDATDPATAFLRQACFMAGATLNRRFPEGLQTRADEDCLVQMLDAAGGRGRGKDVTRTAMACVNASMPELPENLFESLVAVGDAIAREGVHGDIGLDLVDMAGMALISSNGLGGRVARLLQARLGRWPADAGHVLAVWSDNARGDGCGRQPDPLTAEQARFLADAVAGWFAAGRDGAPARFADHTPKDVCAAAVPLWNDILAGLHEAGTEVQRDAGAAVLDALDATLTSHDGAYADVAGYADLEAHLKAVRQQHALLATDSDTRKKSRRMA